MPCNSDHMKQTPVEEYLQKTAQLAVYAGESVGVDIPPAISREASKYYTQDVGQTEFLCSLIRDMDEAQQSSIMYDGRIAQARQLAEWWEKHQEADKKREEKERQTKKEVWIVKGRISGLLEEQAQLPSDTVEWQFSDGPPGMRGSSSDYLDLEEGLRDHSGYIFHFVGDE